MLTPSRWYAAREIYSWFGIFWNSNNCSDRQIQLVESSQPLKREKSSLVTFGIKVPPDPVEPWFVRLCELSPWLPFQLPAIWSKQACKAAIISCNSLRVCYWLEVKETRLATLFANIPHVHHPCLALIPICYEPLGFELFHILYKALWWQNKEQVIFGYASRITDPP